MLRRVALIRTTRATLRNIPETSFIIVTAVKTSILHSKAFLLIKCRQIDNEKTDTLICFT
jgi:hypothetical protein